MGGGGVVLELPLPSGLQHLNHVSRAPPLSISPQKVMDILSLAAWPLVILFHRPAPCWSQHNGRRSASSQSIFQQTWSSKLVSFGKGMTKDLFNTLPESIKTSEQRVSFFFVLLLPFLVTLCDFYPGFKLRCVYPTNCFHYWVVIKGWNGWRSVWNQDFIPTCSKKVVTWCMTEAGEWPKKDAHVQVLCYTVCICMYVHSLTKHIYCMSVSFFFSCSSFRTWCTFAACSAHISLIVSNTLICVFYYNLNIFSIFSFLFFSHVYNLQDYWLIKTK